MKNLVYILFISLSVLFVSCDQNDKNEGRFDDAKSESGWVQFANSNNIQFIYGSASQVSIPVELHTATNKGGTEISYSITDVSGSSAGIIPNRTGTFIIDKDNENEVTLDGFLVIDINDAGLSESVEFDVTLTGTNKPGISIGLSDDSKPVTVRVKICAVNIGSTYAGTAVASTGNVGPGYTVNLVPVEGQTNTFTTNSAWGVQFVPTLAGNPAAIRDYPAIVKVNDDYSVTVTGNDPAFPLRYPGGEGTYNPCTDTFNIVLRQGVFATPFTVTVVWSPVAAD